MQHPHQSSPRPGSQRPPEFQPKLEGRLFTAHDATVDSNCKVHPTARLLYDSLPQYYREVFKNCPMYLEKHMEFVKFLKYMSQTDVTRVDVDSEQLRPLGIQIPTEEGDKKKWQCGVVGCDFKDTLQHLYTHLQQKKHLNLRMFSCQFCKITFNRRHDRNRHEVKMHPNDSNAQTSSVRSQRGVSYHNASSQLPKGRTRAGKGLNRPERRRPAYSDAVCNEEMSTSSDTLSSSEGDDQFSARANSWSPPSFVEFDELHQADTNKPPTPDFAHASGLEGAFELNQEPFEQIPAVAGPPVGAGPTLEPAQCYGYVNVPQLAMDARYNPIPARLPAQSQVFFATPTQQNTMLTTSSSNGLMLASPHHGNRFQAATPVIQPVNNGGMTAQTINNIYHINSPPNPAQFMGSSPQKQLPAQWPASMGFNPVANPQAYDYFHAPTPPQIAPYGSLWVNAPSTGYFHQDYLHRPTGDIYGLQMYSGSRPATYPKFPMGYGTRIQVPCTSMPSDRVTLDTSLMQTRNNAHDKPPNESAMPTCQQNAPNYGELANGYRISIPGLKNYIPPNASRTLLRDSSDVVDEKGSTTTINRHSPPAIYCVRGIKLFIICCLVTMLLSAGLLLHPEWQLGSFTL